ncbi:calcineurin subunit B type 1-like [Antedon mediterranea]|uniref:calcineurin subunit B type 1-like n=1 Tax=Antedon mediterranea TaxID=105859 RepID=UPI003AF97F45
MGNSESLLTEEKIAELEGKTHFNQKEIKQMVKRYSAQIDSTTSAEMTRDGFLSIPEVACTPYAILFFNIYTSSQKSTLMPEEFLVLFSTLSNKATVEEKQKLMFDAFDINRDGDIGFNELFRMYKNMFTAGFTDDQLTELVNSVLAMPNLKTPGRISYEEFSKAISPMELREKVTINLQLV